MFLPGDLYVLGPILVIKSSISFCSCLFLEKCVDKKPKWLLPLEM